MCDVALKPAEYVLRDGATKERNFERFSRYDRKNFYPRSGFSRPMMRHDENYRNLAKSYEQNRDRNQSKFVPQQIFLMTFEIVKLHVLIAGDGA